VRSDFQINDEPLPGYRLIERLGAGGYGEVWRVEAPGGLDKAIKLVFGQQHEKRASREMRALELIRQLRHPFLLSLERIEVVNGRLLIVTELADGSVKDRFDVCTENGSPGIPRQELLHYVRDAADALDFMSEQHGLQHLDIKPENLLLVADHVKVADFGLVKDVTDSSASLVGGMTPLYAAPEVFRGLPTGQSDQYSLAIVYQEMLTGRLPFAGANAAELTMQHLNDEPDLSHLCGAERYVVSRALSKDASHRYKTCREFVEALSESATVFVDSGETKKAAPTPTITGEFSKPSPAVYSPTEFFEEEQGGPKPTQMLVELPNATESVVDLPVIEAEGGVFRPSPVLVLGIGGTAGRVLWHARNEMNRRFGPTPVPAVQMLLVDTDPDSLAEVTGIDGPGLSLEETLNIPLRRPQHYRERWDQLLSWLSRRWLYNIPKSMRTEGLRPLGRLALVDHARQTCQRIRRGMLQAVEADAVAASTALTGQEFRGDALRVYIVASISGGTGSGAVLDTAYALRAMLDKLPVARVSITGVLMHSTGRDPLHCELARVNAYSWFTEFRHFHQSGSAYPGDASCGLPPHEPGVAAFDETYFIELGDGLEQREFDQATQQVADYLLLDALSPAQTLFDAGRAASRKGPELGANSDAANLRSCGIYRQQTASADQCEAAATPVAQLVLANWLSRESGSEHQGVESHTAGDDVSTIIARLQLTPAGIAAQARTLVEAQLGSDASLFLSRWLSERIAANQDCDARRREAVDDVFGGDLGSDARRKPQVLGQHLADILQPLGEKIDQDVRRSIMDRLDIPGHRLNSARATAQALQHHLDTVLAELQRYLGSVGEKLAQIRRSTELSAEGRGSAKRNGLAAASTEQLTHYFELQLDELALRGAERVIRVAMAEIKSTGNDLMNFARELKQIAALSRNSTSANLAADTAANGIGEVEIANFVRSKIDEISARADERLQQAFLKDKGGLFQVVMQGGRLRAQLSAKISEAARSAVHEAWSGRNQNSGESNQCGWGDPPSARAAVEAATPAALSYGGARRIVAILPQGNDAASEAQEFRRAIGSPVSVVVGTDRNSVLCVEAEQLPVERIALGVVERRRDSVEFAKRVHSRSDIVWTPLIPSAPEPVIEPPSGLTTVSVAMDVSLRQTQAV
jgi:hypothetical protein